MVMKLDLLSSPGKFAVVHLPERKHRGLVLQGDTLRTLQQQAQRMRRLLDTGELQDLADEIDDLKEQLQGAVSYFEQVCSERGLPLPY